MGTFYRRRGKRIFDIVGAAGALLLTSPIQLITAIAVYKKMGSPVFFQQERPGLNSKKFTLIKFRTMAPLQESDVTGGPDVQRITPLGNFLRSSSIDELPELWNVMRGDMSLVGPRPLLTAYLERYSPNQARRHEVRPGVTGWAQVNGRNTISWDQKFAMDVWYVDNVSFRLDAKILWRTLKTVISRKGILASTDETMPDFN